jgi:ABC-type branched-subunit amino acid transport system substrate-binding protein
MYVSLGVVVTDRLSPAGVRFARRFGKVQAGVEVQPSAVYAAQAAEVLLDAIARSDGTRASVLEELFATEVRNGLLGSFAFDANGDTTESPVTIMRVALGGGSNRIGSVEGGVAARVLRPSPSLVKAGS